MTTSATSSSARSSIAPRLPHLRRVVLEYIASQGAHGSTDEQAQGALHLSENSCRPRRCELVDLGMVSCSLGETRPVQSGNQASVFHVTDVGLKALGLPESHFHVKADAPKPIKRSAKEVIKAILANLKMSVAAEDHNGNAEAASAYADCMGLIETEAAELLK